MASTNPDVTLMHRSFSRWLPSNHLAAAICVSITLGAGGWHLVRQSRSQAAGAQQRLKVAQANLALLARSSEQRSAPENFTTRLPVTARTDDLVSDAGRFAQARGVQISSLAIQKQPTSPRELGQIRFAISAQSGYQAFKTWLADMQARYPTMGVKTLSVRAPQNDARQEIQLALIFYVKD
jgi:hypothetical protein